MTQPAANTNITTPVDSSATSSSQSNATTNYATESTATTPIAQDDNPTTSTEAPFNSQQGVHTLG